MPLYQYAPHRDYGGSIGDLIARRGDIEANRAIQIANAQAQAAHARGQIWGQAIGSIGDIVAGGFQTYARDKAEAPARQLEAATKIANLERTEAETAEIRRKGDDADRLTRRETAWMGMLEMYPEGAPPEVLQRETLKIWGPKEGATMLSGFKALADLQKGEVTDARDTALRLTLAYEQLSPALQAQAWPQIRAATIRGGLGTPESVPEGPPDKTYLKGIKAWALGKEPETSLHNVPAGASVIDEADPSKAVFTAPGAAQSPTEASLALRAASGDEEAKQALAIMRAQHPTQAPQMPNTPMWAKGSDGVVRLMTPTEIRTTGAGQPDTADMRNKAAGKKMAALAVQAVRDLGGRIITKVGPAQRAQAIERGAEAVWGTDPEFRTYQDSRMALAGTLAVEQQGSRVSDADVKALWLPMVPDAYRDTAESNALKWKLIDAMRGIDGGSPNGQIVVTAPDGSKHPFATQAEADNFKRLAGIN